ncbi:MAG: hypothetical protein AAF961_18745, partial [Planctomycetota bacterium]
GEEQLDEAALREVASSTGGKYFFAGDREQLQTIYNELDRLDTRPVDSQTYRPRRELFAWPLAFALLCSVAFHTWHAARRLRRRRHLQPVVTGST